MNVKVGMSNVEMMLELAVEEFGVSDKITLAISQKRDKEVINQQRMLKNLQDKGFLAAMAREFKNGNKL